MEGRKMGPRIREDNEEGEGVNVREGGPRGRLLREVGWRMRMGSCPRLHEGRTLRGNDGKRAADG